MPQHKNNMVAVRRETRSKVAIITEAKVKREDIFHSDSD